MTSQVTCFRSQPWVPHSHFPSFFSPSSVVLTSLYPVSPSLLRFYWRPKDRVHWSPTTVETRISFFPPSRSLHTPVCPTGQPPRDVLWSMSGFQVRLQSERITSNTFDSLFLYVTLLLPHGSLMRIVPTFFHSPQTPFVLVPYYYCKDPCMWIYNFTNSLVMIFVSNLSFYLSDLKILLHWLVL